jgi:superfamily II DNA/RNA helicase
LRSNDGKTAAFALILQLYAERAAGSNREETPHPYRAYPTRELAIQIAESQRLWPEPCATVIFGVAKRPKPMHSNAVPIYQPRQAMLDLMNQGYFLARHRHFCADEADRMPDMVSSTT